MKLSRDTAKIRLKKHFSPLNLFVIALVAVVNFCYGAGREDYDPLIPAVSLIVLLAIWTTWALIDPWRMLKSPKVDALFYYPSWLGMGFVAPWLLMDGREGVLALKFVFVAACGAYLYVDRPVEGEAWTQTGTIWSRMLLYVILAGTALTILFPKDTSDEVSALEQAPRVEAALLEAPAN